MSNLKKGELVSWMENERKKRLMFFYLFLLTIAGTVLAAIIAPVIVCYLVLAFVPYSAAAFIGALAGIALIVGVVRLLSLNLLYSDFIRIINTPNSRKNNQRWDSSYIFLSIAALGIGITLSVFIGPIIVNSLMLIGATYGLAVFISIVSCLTLILLTSELFLQMHVLKSVWDKTGEFWKRMEGRPWMTAFILAAQITGFAVGIYLATWVFPLIVAALAIPHGLAVLTAIIVSVGLVSASYSLFNKTAVLLSDFMGLAVGMELKKSEQGHSSSGTLLTASEGSPVKADAILNAALPLAFSQEYEDGTTIVENVILPGLFQAKSSDAG